MRIGLEHPYTSVRPGFALHKGESFLTQERPELRLCWTAALCPSLGHQVILRMGWDVVLWLEVSYSVR